MARPLDASMPPDLDLGPGFTIRVTALAVSDGSVVAGVSVSNFSILLDGTGAAAGETGSLAYGPFMLVPGPGA